MSSGNIAKPFTVAGIIVQLHKGIILKEK